MMKSAGSSAIFEHEKDFGVDERVHWFDDVENESRPPGQRFVQ